MRFRPLTALAGTAILCSVALAAPASATGSTQPASIVAALAASAANNPPGSATDHNWNDLDILLAASTALPFDTIGNPRVATLTQLGTLGLGDGEFDIKAPVFGLVGLKDDDRTDPDPFWFGRTVRTADGGTIHVIAGVLRPVDLAAVQGLLD